ncbi:aldo/keto reductase [Halorubrum lacusprofundi]|jgi:diketogulonate reductase-like aldo/keto reductase|uniref:Aldo/keto reductase n=1 Tax=Halorubrum lacusprofundi (strain ATCC 49239 / DSM 5036 / JCM 8891 / ACAM 34) TaxID=416348 RepID=B9LQT6_HALLT|nr:aldo/keto reductase [Halorubrum lacusprofundi]ACM55688.1 aldo/keto reductase [Halorubrum lacusprofundi ATCC 49239]MCG1007157.1 aldo/keto reductase [Halorubrum lacusprofundi]
MSNTFDRLGYGTYKLADGEECVGGVAHAIETGYRHIDTAQGYDNEASVSVGIDRTDVGREDLFVATKLSTGNLSYDDATATARVSRDRLGVDSIDLLYVHWPINTYDPEETLPALDDLVDDGVVDRIGLSNFQPDQLDEAIDRLDHDVFAHQVECHPLLQQEKLRERAAEHDHWLVAYSPIARNRVADVDVLQEIAAAHDASPAQVSLAWLLSKDRVAPIPKAADFDHVEANWAAREIDLTADEIGRIDTLDRGERIVDFEEAPWNHE